MSAVRGRKPPRSIAVGFAGKQGREYLPLLMKYSRPVGLVESSAEGEETARRLGLPHFDSVESALRAVDFDLALITVPHSAHYAMCELLLGSGKHVIKEKPFAITERDAESLTRLAVANDRSVYTLVQRSFVATFDFARRHLPQIGRPYWFAYDYHLDLPEPTCGWRADYARALGGVMLDMGYHVIDVINAYFGMPASVQSTFLHCYEEMRLRRLEDLASVQLYYPSGSMAGTVTVSRHYHEKTERLTVLGAEGTFRVEPGSAELRSRRGEYIDRLSPQTPKGAVVEAMFSHYVRHLDDREYRAAHLARQRSTVRLIDGIYASGAGRTACGAPPAVTVGPRPGDDGAEPSTDPNGGPERWRTDPTNSHCSVVSP
ncbi:Predicted dehydrogenase [Marinactinospora thermotolerans DSM 45154]|uniref:Predicted dehydrogenase n=1 Tax=Marinactinospora thermotolerans DSM 45154 TaxID=1122192 RepID=A0A1T4T543_9ACTN|nr:Predicted dehydrogenase [Marinactinospora thermotolerans DSM 45154]